MIPALRSQLTVLREGRRARASAVDKKKHVGHRPLCTFNYLQRLQRCVFLGERDYLKFQFLCLFSQLNNRLVQNYCFVLLLVSQPRVLQTKSRVA